MWKGRSNIHIIETMCIKTNSWFIYTEGSGAENFKADISNQEKLICTAMIKVKIWKSLWVCITRLLPSHLQNIMNVSIENCVPVSTGGVHLTPFLILIQIF